MRFIESFKNIDKRFIYVLLCDLLFFAALALSIMVFAKILLWGLGSFFQIPGKMLALSKMADLTQADAALEGVGMMMNQFKSKIALSFIVLWASFVLSFTVFKGIAWGVIKKQDINKKYFIQFIKLNACWFAIISVVLILFFLLTKPSTTGFAVVLLFAVSLYFTPLLYAVFNQKKAIKENFKRLWYVGVEKIYYFILPGIAGFFILFFLMIILSAVVMKVSAGSLGYVLLAGFALWQSWFKYYIHVVVRNIR